MWRLRVGIDGLPHLLMEYLLSIWQRMNRITHGSIMAIAFRHFMPYLKNQQVIASLSRNSIF